MNMQRVNTDRYDRSELAGLVLRATGPIAADYSNALLEGTPLFVRDGVTLCGERPVLNADGKVVCNMAGQPETAPFECPLPHGHPWRHATPTGYAAGEYPEI